MHTAQDIHTFNTVHSTHIYIKHTHMVHHQTYTPKWLPKAEKKGWRGRIGME